MERGKRLTPFAISVICIVALSALALILVIGTDTAWEGSCRENAASSSDGDVVNAMLYRPKTATMENPARSGSVPWWKRYA